MKGINIPEHTKGALERYIINKYPPGSFLACVMYNDLMGAMMCADHMNRHAIFDICSWLYNNAPSNSYGSYENYKSWLNGDKNE